MHPSSPPPTTCPALSACTARSIPSGSVCCIAPIVSRLTTEYSASAVELRASVYGEGLGLGQHAFIFMCMFLQDFLKNGLETWVFGEGVWCWRDGSRCANCQLRGRGICGEKREVVGCEVVGEGILVWFSPCVYLPAGKHTMWELLGSVPIIRLNGFVTQLRAATFNGDANMLDMCCRFLSFLVIISSGTISANGANTN